MFFYILYVKKEKENNKPTTFFSPHSQLPVVFKTTIKSAKFLWLFPNTFVVYKIIMTRRSGTRCVVDLQHNNSLIIIRCQDESLYSRVNKVIMRYQKTISLFNFHWYYKIITRSYILTGKWYIEWLTPSFYSIHM